MPVHSEEYAAKLKARATGVEAIEIPAPVVAANPPIQPHECQPTDAMIGSISKIAVMAARYAAGQPIHHDSDNRTVDPEAPVRSSMWGLNRDFTNAANYTKQVHKVSQHRLRSGIHKAP